MPVADLAILAADVTPTRCGEVRLTRDARPESVILVVHDVEETRDGIEMLLKAVGHRVETARNETEAVDKAIGRRPDLILVCLAGPSGDVVDTGRRVRAQAALGDGVPVVVFCVQAVSEGAEVPLDGNVYITRPDNFDQLRAFLGRLIDAAVTSRH
jgi:DNA-binding response OmpR family regulator